MAQGKSVKEKEPRLFDWKIAGVLLISFFAFIPALNNTFVNWDDIVYVLNNEMITSFSPENIRKMFSTFFMGNYHPITILSLSLDHLFFKFSAPGYHFHSIAIHIANTLLVYVFFFKLLKSNQVAAVFIAAIFALHPMHVESVAWVSARKDLLYTFYFFLSLIVYQHYTEKGTRKLYLLSLLLFIGSLLSKAQAVTLPLILVLMDYFFHGGLTRKNLVEKIPFFIFSLVFGIIAVFAQADSHYINPLEMPAWQSMLYAPYSLCVYILKFLFPLKLTSLYEYPVAASGTLPWYVFISPLVIPALLLLMWKIRKGNGLILFGMLFFLVTIFPVLQFLPVGKAVVAERYTYVSYVGLGLVFTITLLSVGKKKQSRGNSAVMFVGISFLIFMFLLTWNRNKVWRDSITLWTDVLDKNPRSVTAYMNRAFLYNKEKQFEKAIEDCSTCLGYDSTNSSVFKNRAIAYNNTGKFSLALEDYSMAIRYDSTDTDLFLYRGIIFTDKLREYDAGITDFRKYLSKYPDSENVNFNLLVAYFSKMNYDSAGHFCRQVLRINPGNEQAKGLLTRIDTLNYEKKQK